MWGRIAQVTLHRQGMAWVRRVVQVQGSARLTQRFPADGVEVLLRSLSVEDRGGGYLAGITYPAGEEGAGEREVTLEVRGEGEREVQIAYALALPAWRVTYRLQVDTRARTVTLWGFAQLVNLSGEAWSEVGLSLVGGQPLTLRSSRYDPTTGAGGEAQRAAAPPQASATTTFHRLRREGASSRRDMSMTFVVESEPGGREAEAPQRLDVATPVSVPSGSVALVPILRRTLADAPLVGLLEEGARSGHPLLAARLRNDTHLTLEAGPTTVLVDGAWAGETLLERMAPGEERLIPFAVEAACQVEVEFGASPEREQSLTPGRGYLFHSTRTRDVTTWSVRTSPGALIERLYIDHTSDRHAEYLDSPEPAARLAGVDRFEVPLLPGGRGRLALTQRRTQTETLWVTPEQSREHLELARRLGADPAVVEALALLVDIAGAISQHRAERARLDERCAALSRQVARQRKALEVQEEDDPARVAELRLDEEALQQAQEQRHAADRQVQEHKLHFRDEAVRWLGEA